MKRLLLWGLSLASFAISAQNSSLPAGVNVRKLAKIQDIKDGVFRPDLDDPARRLEQEFNMLKDPSTGKIPDNIHERELAFVNSSKAKLIKGNFLLGGMQGALEWTKRGPYNVGGRTRALAIDVTNENIILAGGVSGGVWRSTDGGSSWTKTTGASDLHSVTSLAQDTRAGHEDTWYYVTGELIGNSASETGASYAGDGVYKSTDGGQSWTQLSSTKSSSVSEFDSYFDYNWKVIVNPINGNVYVASYGRIWRSTDGGDNWTAVIAENNASTTDIIVTSTGRLYASFDDGASDTNQGVLTSTDGVNWTNITPNNFPNSWGRTILAVAPSNENVLYVFTYSSSFGNTGHGFYKYTANTGTWSDRSSNMPAYGGNVGDLNSQGEYNMTLAVHPTQENTVFVGGTNLYRSTNGFANSGSTSWIGGYSTDNDVSQYENHHPDVHNLIFYPSSANTALCSTDGGVHKTTNILGTGGDTPVDWTDLNNGYQTTQVHAMAFEYEANTTMILAGFQDNGTWFSSGITETDPWSENFSGDGAFCSIEDGGLTRYVSSQNANVYKYVYHSNGNLNYWTRISPAMNNPAFIAPFIIDPDDDNIMYLPDGNDIMRNNGLNSMSTWNNSETSENWTRLTNTGTSSTISALDVAGGTLYYGTTNGDLFKMANAKTGTPSPTDISSNSFPNNAHIQCVQIDPTNTNSVFVVFSNYGVKSIFHSTDAGSSWTDISGNLEENANGSGDGPSVRWLDVVSNNGQKMYLVGTSTGVYSTDQINGTSTTWIQQGLETIGQVVTTMIHSNVNGDIAIGTHGNGLFSSNISNAVDSPPIAEFSANVVSISVGGSVDFTDESTGGATSWAWTFTGAQTTSSTDQNPSGIVYNTPGCFEVSLTASNNNGSNTESKICYITVTNDNTGSESCDCNSVTNVGDNENLTVYNFGTGGYVTGRNIYEIRNFAEPITNTGIKQLKQVRVGTVLRHQDDPNAYFTLNIYDVNGGLPNTVLHSQEVNFNDLESGGFTDIDIDETVVVNGDFFVDLEIRDGATDTLLFYTTENRANLADNKLLVYRFGEWSSYEELGVTFAASLGLSVTLCDNFYQESVEACEGKPYTYPDGTVVNSVVGGETHISSLISSQGCDSLVYQTLTVIQGSSSVSNITVCHGESFTTPQGQELSSSTGIFIYTETYEAANGCDSLITYNLTELSQITNTVNIEVCVGEDYTTPEGTVIQTMNGTGTHTETLQASNGCDSLVTYVVTENEPTLTLERNICEGDDFTLINGTTIQNVISDQTYEFTFTSVDGCDSVVTEEINVVELDNGISRSGNLLLSAMYGVEFQWLDCDNGDAEITGATLRTFAPSDNGNFKVKVSQFGCEAVSECLFFDGYTSVNNLAKAEASVYPNPASDRIFIEVAISQEIQAEIYDMSGKLVLSSTLTNGNQYLEIANLAAGDYVIRLSDGNSEKTISFTKE